MKGSCKGIGWLLWAIAAAVRLLILSLAHFRWRGPTLAQQAALNQVLAPLSMSAGKNAFAWMLLFDKVVDDNDIERLAELDVESEQTTPPGGLIERFAARAQALRSGTRANGIADDGTCIGVDNLHPPLERRFSLPLAMLAGTGP